MTDGRCGILVITESHDFRHFLLQISPIEWRFLFLILGDAARRVVNWIAAEDEQLFDFSTIHSVGGQLENAPVVFVPWKFANNQRAPDIFEGGIHRVSE